MLDWRSRKNVFQIMKNKLVGAATPVMKPHNTGRSRHVVQRAFLADAFTLAIWQVVKTITTPA